MNWKNFNPLSSLKGGEKNFLWNRDGRNSQSINLWLLISKWKDIETWKSCNSISSRCRNGSIALIFWQWNEKINCIVNLCFIIQYWWLYLVKNRMSSLNWRWPSESSVSVEKKNTLWSTILRYTAQYATTRELDASFVHVCACVHYVVQRCVISSFEAKGNFHNLLSVFLLNQTHLTLFLCLCSSLSHWVWMNNFQNGKKNCSRKIDRSAFEKLLKEAQMCGPC